MTLSLTLHTNFISFYQGRGYTAVDTLRQFVVLPPSHLAQTGQPASHGNFVTLQFDVDTTMLPFNDCYMSLKNAKQALQLHYNCQKKSTWSTWSTFSFPKRTQ